MEMKRPLDEVRSVCQKKTIPELENIIKTIEKEIVELQDYLKNRRRCKRYHDVSYS